MTRLRPLAPLVALVWGCGAPRTTTSEAPHANRASKPEVALVAAPADLGVYRDPAAPTEARVSDLLGRMTLREKAEMLSGSGWMESQGNARLGIPPIKMADGPMGVRNWTGSSAITNAATTNAVYSTAYPAGIGMAATWDVELARLVGQAIAKQTKALGRDMILAPTVNIHRTPLWGRNFEGYGEDPYLAARMAVAYIEGVQGEGVIATVKHLAANNQEHERHRVDVRIDLRALHEIYLPAFKAAVEEAHVWSVMSAYNKVNGAYCAESTLLLTDVLRKQWGFRGFVVSDWGSTYSTAPTVRAGMDLEMPGGEPMRNWSARADFQAEGRGAGWLTVDKVLTAVESGSLEVGAIDESVRRVLRVLFESGLFDRVRKGDDASPTYDVDAPEYRNIARVAAVRSLVLLKNDRNTLPLDRNRVRSIAVIGPNGAKARPGGGGSSQVRTKYSVSPFEGMKELGGNGIRVTHAVGAPMPGESSESPPREQQKLREEAAALARASDAAVVVVGYSPKLESEGFDRPSMDLPLGQDLLIDAVSKANPRTIVVVVAGAPIDMTRWVRRVPAILYAWYGGQEAGTAIARLLYGIDEPSGKLPISFPKRLEDSTAYGYYPGKDLVVDYAEGIYVGYRGLERRKIVPMYPFGHGLSYTKFDYANLELDRATMKRGGRITVALDVQNSGKRGGSEVVQLYVRDVVASVDRPQKELKGFRRVTLAPGERRRVTFDIDAAALSFFEPKQRRWVAEPGQFEVLVGASSHDVRLTKAFELEAGE